MCCQCVCVWLAGMIAIARKTYHQINLMFVLLYRNTIFQIMLIHIPQSKYNYFVSINFIIVVLFLLSINHYTTPDITHIVF